MKKGISLLIAVIVLCVITGGCENRTRGSLPDYVTYEVDDIIHIPLFSSASPDYFLEQNKDTLFKVGSSSFEMITASATVTFDEQVRYIEEKLNGYIYTMGEDIDVIDLSAFTTAVSYKVMKGEADTGYRLYYLDEEVWIGHFSWFGAKQDAWWADYIFSVKKA